MEAAENYFIALDAGGTMTDAVILGTDGSIFVGKALTDYKDESNSFIASIKDACNPDIPVDYVLSRALNIVYAGTIMLNALLTRSGQKVGLILTRGLEDYLLMERGEGPWLGLPYQGRLHSATHFHNEPYIPKHLIRGIHERIDMFGNEVIPLYEQEVEEQARDLISKGVEAIAIMFVFSYLNPSHEAKAKDICIREAKKLGRDIAVITSSEVARTNKEYSRLMSLIAQAYAGEFTRLQFVKVEERAKSFGYRFDLLTLLAHGGITDIRYPRIYESYVSGPIGGILGAKHIAELVGIQDICCTDVGGTSFDAGIITKGIIPVAREPLLIHNRANLPTVLTQSIGAGTGSELWIDPVTGKLEIGPKSAGNKVGACYMYDKPTISDCQLILGYLPEDNFLGGTIKLNRDAAYKAVEVLATQLGENVYRFAFGAIEFLHERMRQHIKAMLIGRGYDPSEYTLMVYGGGGPLHLWGLAEGMDFKHVMTFTFAAVFSAFGILTGDYSYRYHKGIIGANPKGDDLMSQMIRASTIEAINSAFDELEKQALLDISRRGIPYESVELDRYVYVRYTGQLSDLEVPYYKSRLNDEADLFELCVQFEDVYSTVYPSAAKYSDAGYQIMEVAVVAREQTTKPVLVEYDDYRSDVNPGARKGKRATFYRDTWYESDIYDMDSINAGAIILGPAVIEHSATTLVVPPGYRVHFDKRRFIWYEKA